MNKSGVSIQESGVRIGAPRRSLLAKPGLCGKTLSLTFTIAAFAAFAVETLLSSTVAELRWPVEVSRPQSQEIPLFRGETIDLAVKVTQFAAPLDLTGATVVFHARTNAQPLNTSYQVTGTVGRAGLSTEATNGWATVRLIVDRDMPLASTMSYTYLISSTNGDLCRVNGTLKITGTAAGATSTAVASLVADPYGAAQAVSNALASALQVETAARIALGVAMSNANAIASTNLQAALNYASAAGSNYAATVAASTAGATNDAHVASVDPHGDRVYSDGLMATGTAPRAMETYRTIQPDTNAWVSITNGTAVMHREWTDMLAGVGAFGVTTGTLWEGPPSLGEYGEPDYGWVSGWHLYMHGAAKGPGVEYRWKLTNGSVTNDGDQSYMSVTYSAVFGPYTVGGPTLIISPTNDHPIATVPGTVLLLSQHNTDTNAHIDIRGELAAKPSSSDVANIIQNYAWPSMPQVDVGRSNAPVSLVLSNDVLYLYGS